MTLYLGFMEYSTPHLRQSKQTCGEFPFWDDIHKFWLARMRYKTERNCCRDEWFLISVDVSVGEGQKGKREKKTSHGLAAASRWIVIWMVGVWTNTFIRLPNALINFGVGGLGPNRAKPFGFSSLVLVAGPLALISFLQGEQHTQKAK